MPTVHVLATGGTISSRSADSSSGANATDNAATLVQGIDEQTSVRSSDVLTTLSFLLTFADLRRLKQAVDQALADEECTGVVITHGTDTMEETAFFLDLVHTSDKPVVLTGAQRTADSSTPDGPMNLTDAVVTAAHPAMRGCGVLVCFAGKVYAARGVRKTQTWELDAFTGDTLVARVVRGQLQPLAVPRRRPALPTPDERFDTTRVEIVPCFLGATAHIMHHLVDQPTDGIVLAGTGIGNAGPDFVDAVHRAAKASIPVVLSTRVAWGPVFPVYASGGGVDLVDAGAIASGELNAPQARILTALLVATGPATDVADRFLLHA